jgi:hypothetical protein
MDHESSINYKAFCLLFPKFDWNIIMYILCCLIVIANPSNLYNEQSTPFLIHDLYLGLYQIRVITKLPNSEQSYKGKVKTHNYINRQNQSTTGNCHLKNAYFVAVNKFLVTTVTFLYRWLQSMCNVAVWVALLPAAELCLKRRCTGHKI